MGQIRPRSAIASTSNSSTHLLVEENTMNNLDIDKNVASTSTGTMTTSHKAKKPTNLIAFDDDIGDDDDDDGDKMLSSDDESILKKH